MNISHKHKVIWWAPAKCGTKIVRTLLFGYDFFSQGFQSLAYLNPTTRVKENESPLEFKKLEETYQSHLIVQPKEYDDYKIILSIRNPYDRMFSIFLNFQLQTFALPKNLKNELKKQFNIWVNKIMLNEKLIIERKFLLGVNTETETYFCENLFKGRMPDFLIRMENIQEDLEKLDFIKNDLSWDSKKVEEELKTNKIKIEREYKFNSMYDIETAKKVYTFYKTHFYFCDYNPFSFTTETLTEKEKINFLHDIL